MDESAFSTPHTMPDGAYARQSILSGLVSSLQRGFSLTCLHSRRLESVTVRSASGRPRNIRSVKDSHET